jgi:hypothetical protein
VRSVSANRPAGSNCAQIAHIFFDNWDDVAPSRSMVVYAYKDDEVGQEDEAEMDNAARVELTRAISEQSPNAR